MEISFTLWSLRDVLQQIPFDSPAAGEALHLDFTNFSVPHYIKNGFKVSFFFVPDTFPNDAVCSIYSPKKVVTIVIIIKQKFERALKAWLETGSRNHLISSCRRRELYCHEACHLVAIIRAFPSERSSQVRKNFIDKIKRKMMKSISAAENSMSIPLISAEKSEESPLVFDNDHFRYEKDRLNYFRLFQELMLDYDRMNQGVKDIVANISGRNIITFEDVARTTLVSQEFFQLFPEKLDALKVMLAEEMNRQAS